ncbi:unnamed protein product, partial [Didymodactylos carnosus]
MDRYEPFTAETEIMEDCFARQVRETGIDEWASTAARKENEQFELFRRKPNADLSSMFPNKSTKMSINLDQLRQMTVKDTDSIRLLRTMNEEQQDIFYNISLWCLRKQHILNVELVHLFLTGPGGNGKV